MFSKGQGGRTKGARNKISHAFLKDLLARWEESGADALKIMAKLEPGNFVKVVAAVLPKELEISDNRLAELNDDELELLINELRTKLRSGIATDAGGGEESQTHH